MAPRCQRTGQGAAVLAGTEEPEPYNGAMILRTPATIWSEDKVPERELSQAENQVMKPAENSPREIAPLWSRSNSDRTVWARKSPVPAGAEVLPDAAALNPAFI